MADISQQWACDLTVSASGDLALAAGAASGHQRLLRRLLTTPGEYIWQPGYGAGLPKFIGEPTDAAHVRAVIRSQIFKESSVARVPEPSIDVQISFGAAMNSVYVYIQYVEVQSGQTQNISFALDS